MKTAANQGGRTPVDWAGVRNVLILRTDHLGDLLLSTPLIRTMRTALPGRRFTLVASPANADALTGWNAIDEILLFDPRWPLLRKWRFARELGAGRDRNRWDLCLVLSPRTPSYLLGWLSGAPLRAGIVYSRRVLARLMSPVWLTHPVVLALDEQLAENRQIPHEVEQLAKIATALGLPTTEPGPLEFPLSLRETDWAGTWLKGQANEDFNNSIVIGIHGAGKWLSKGWTADDFMKLVRSVADGGFGGKTATLRIIVTFGPGDQLLEQAVIAELRSHPDARILLPGPLTISRWAAILSLCDAVISPDTGSLHLAVAVNRPVVAMYEPDTFFHCSTQWAPWQVPHAVVRRSKPAATIPVIIAELLRLLAGSPDQSPDATAVTAKAENLSGELSE
jgi:heptosyltransferase-2